LTLAVFCKRVRVRVKIRVRFRVRFKVRVRVRIRVRVRVRVRVTFTSAKHPLALAISRSLLKYNPSTKLLTVARLFGLARIALQPY
jgi:hypothetical protein